MIMMMMTMVVVVMFIVVDLGFPFIEHLVAYDVFCPATAHKQVRSNIYLKDK